MSTTPHDILRHLREKRGWSQARLAELVGTDAGNVSRWERGRSVPSPHFREKLCELFDLSADELGFVQNEAPRTPVLPESAPAPLPLHAMSIDGATRRERLLAVLGYTCGWVSGLYVFFLARGRYARFHAVQAVCFFGASTMLCVLLIVILAVVKRVGGATADPAAALATFVLLTALGLTTVFCVIAWVVGMTQAWRGRWYRLPFIASIVHEPPDLPEIDAGALRAE